MRKNQKRKLLVAVFSLALLAGLLPQMAFAADPIATDVVIHKMAVQQGTAAVDHDGSELATPPGTPLAGVQFKYWVVADDVTDAQKSQLAGLRDLAAAEAYAAANPSVLSNPQTTAATGADGTVRLNNMAEGKYFFAEVSNPAIEISDYVGVPFLLELPAMKPDGTAYYGTGANAMHVYPKNVIATPGLDVETRNSDGDPIGPSEMDLYKWNEDTGEWEYVDPFTLPNGTITLEDLESGKYKLVNTKAPDGYLVDDRPIYFDVDNGQITFPDYGPDGEPNNPKAGFEPGDGSKNDTLFLTMEEEPKPEKAVDGTDEASYQIGDTITWEVTIPVPNEIADYEYYRIVDTLDSQLSWVGNGNVTVLAGSTALPASAYTASISGQVLTISFAPSALVAYQGQIITITYDTVINATAVMGQPVKNNVSLEFNNGHGGEGTTVPEEPPAVWTGGIKFLKVDGNSQTMMLSGAEFKIATNAAGTDFIKWNAELIAANSAGSFVTPVDGNDIVMVSNASGQFEIKGLAGGTYYLVEVKAPLDSSGHPYNLMRDPAAFEITKTSYEANASDGVKILNRQGWTPPMTGGMGTLLFTLVGCALMTLGAFLFFRKRKETQGAAS
ncbi:MAG: SpaH/EbpB family LPXTG-anchored major pilin [Coriobacteriaceae bacterium]|jgi:fimbrial isopeptide formation D2 family protein/LPXTG-motif cell wall-anchored protein|nr:SpaH/EbpB family LPXTG-anchored major pilin [Coriobacteriaceae bacterium]